MSVGVVELIFQTVMKGSVSQKVNLTQPEGVPELQRSQSSLIR